MAVVSCLRSYPAQFDPSETPFPTPRMTMNGHRRLGARTGRLLEIHAKDAYLRWGS
jgi:hypothetical protein